MSVTMVDKESEVMSLSYAYEKFFVAVDGLVRADDDLRTRLRDAYVGSLVRVELNDLPEGDLRDTVKGIQEDLIWATPKGDEGSVAATVALLDELEADAIARRIFETFLKLRDLDNLETDEPT